MNKLALCMVILVANVGAQDNSGTQRLAGCGRDQTKFEVKRQTHSHPIGCRNQARHWCMLLGIQN